MPEETWHFATHENPTTRGEIFQEMPLKCIISANKYGRYCIPKSSSYRPAAHAVSNRGVWEPDTIDFVRANVGTGDIVHAGTYFGDFIPAFSNALSPQAILWAYEPNSENFLCAQATKKFNKIRNVFIRHAALASQAGTVPLKIRNSHGSALGGGSVVTSSSVEADCEIAASTSIDISVPTDRIVSIIQLDVEGYELNALQGGLQIIQRCRPIVIVETGIGSDDVGVVDFLRKLGYQSIGWLHENRAFSTPGRQINAAELL